LLSGAGDFHFSVIVAMASMLMVQMITDEKVRVVAMRYTFMTAGWPVDMILFVAPAFVAGCATFRICGSHFNPMLVYAVSLNVVHMAIMKIICVAVVLYGRMAATAAMSVVVTFVCFLGFRHFFFHPSVRSRR
jgi:hypothetical protein